MGLVDVFGRENPKSVSGHAAYIQTDRFSGEDALFLWNF